MNPDRYGIIYDSKYDSDDNVSNGSPTIAPISSCSSTYSTFPKAYQNYYYNEYHEGILEIVKTFSSGLLNQIVDKTMVAAVKGEWRMKVSCISLIDNSWRHGRTISVWGHSLYCYKRYYLEWK